MASLRKVWDKSSLLLMVLAIFVSACLWYKSTHRVPVVIVGPVDLEQGIVGLVSEGMTRHQVINLLGRPLRRRETRAEANRRGYEHPLNDYFAGVYAEVFFYPRTDTVGDLYFKLDEFTERFGGELRVVLRYRGRSVSVSRQLTLTQARKPEFYGKLGLTRSQVSVNGAGLYIKTPLYEGYHLLQFSYGDGHLQSVSVGVQ